MASVDTPSVGSPVSPPAAVAFFGLGNMGLPLALRLADAGYRVSAYDINPAAREAFREAAGIEPAVTGADAIAGSSAVITILPHGKAVQTALLCGDPAAIEHLQAGGIVIDMSSSSPVDTVALGERLSARGIHLLDAPVSGGVVRAIDGSLAIMVGGENTVLERCVPLLSVMGTSIFHTGKLGSGHAMKALNNYVSAAGLVAAAEALIIGSRFGLDADLIIDVLNNSSGRNNSTERKMKQFVISGTFGSGFGVGLMAKDLSIANDLARYLGVEAPQAQLAQSLWEAARQALGEKADHTEIYRYLASKSSARAEPTE